MLRGSHTQQNEWSHSAGFRHLLVSSSAQALHRDRNEEHAALSLGSGQPTRHQINNRILPLSACGFISLIPNGEVMRVEGSSPTVVSNPHLQSKPEVQGLQDTSPYYQPGCLGWAWRVVWNGEKKQKQKRKFQNKSKYCFGS